MITLLHGDDTAKSRDQLHLLKSLSPGRELRVVDGKRVTDDALIQAMSSGSLFGGDTLVIVENLFSGLGKKIKRTQELGALLKQTPATTQVILWEEKELGKTAIASLGPGVTIQLFKLPTIIFQFLDSIKPGNFKSLILLYNQLLESEPAELIHAMFVRRLRQLIAVCSGSVPSGVSPWQLGRLTNQAHAFTLERLTTLYKDLREIEYKRNTGSAILSVKESTELLLIEV